MINLLSDKISPVFWLAFHIILGVISTFTFIPLVFWFYLVLFSSVFNLVRPHKNSFILLTALITYLTSFELLARMSQASPYIPYELGKYLLFFLLCFGILKGYRKGKIGWVMLLLLFPGICLNVSDQFTIKNMVFNLLGPINVVLAIIFFKNQVIDETDLIKMLRLLLYPLISVLAFTIIKTPNLESVEFTLGANFETTGGFGSNQVSTSLGLGAFLTFLFWRNKWTLTGFRWMDFVLFIAFIFRGFLTFSRGGMIGGAIGILLVLWFSRNLDDTKRGLKPAKTFLTLFSVLIILFITFRYADSITGGKLSLRYQGETAGTLKGTKVKDLNTYTSNRYEIFKDDLKLWKENPLLGVGIGRSTDLRETTSGLLSHVEMSRLLSEHGLLGLIYIIILFLLGYNIYRLQRFNLFGAILLALFIIAVFTTFHAAMRTYISPLLIGLSMLQVTKESYE